MSKDLKEVRAGTKYVAGGKSVPGVSTADAKAPWCLGNLEETSVVAAESVGRREKIGAGHAGPAGCWEDLSFLLGEMRAKGRQGLLPRALSDASLCACLSYSNLALVSPDLGSLISPLARVVAEDQEC